MFPITQRWMLNASKEFLSYADRFMWQPGTPPSSLVVLNPKMMMVDKRGARPYSRETFEGELTRYKWVLNKEKYDIELLKNCLPSTLTESLMQQSMRNT